MPVQLVGNSIACAAGQRGAEASVEGGCLPLWPLATGQNQTLRKPTLSRARVRAVRDSGHVVGSGRSPRGAEGASCPALDQAAGPSSASGRSATWVAPEPSGADVSTPREPRSLV